MRALAVSVLLAAGCSSCAGWQGRAETGIRVANSAVDGLGKMGFGLFRARCMAIAEKCAANANDVCLEGRACIAEYRSLTRRLAQAYTLLAKAQTALALSREAEYAAALAEALRVVDDVRRALQALEGLVKDDVADMRPRANAPVRRAERAAQWM